MDKDLLRIVIIATGAVVIIGMLVWSFISSQKEEQQDFDFEADDLKVVDDELEEALLSTEPEEFIVDLQMNTSSDDVEPIFKEELVDDSDGLVEEDLLKFEAPIEEPVAEEPMVQSAEIEVVDTPPKVEIPEVIQFRIMAHNQEGFNGLDMLQAFSSAELQYGNLGIFERLDTNRQVDFGVASMVGSGVFPAKEDELEGFFSPGLVFFMQPKVLNDPLIVFDAFIDTIQMLALQLGGFECDGRGQPLTAEGVFELRAKLEVGK